MVGTADSVLIRDALLLQSVLYREVPLHTRITDLRKCFIVTSNTNVHSCPGNRMAAPVSLARMTHPRAAIESA